MINVRHAGWVCSLIIGLSVSVGHAQDSGNITGHVVTVRGGLPVPGVNVVVTGTLFAGVTDVEGAYTIRSVPSGTYTVQVHALGFRPASQTVEVAAGIDAVVDFRLRLPNPELEDLEAASLREVLQPTASLGPPRIRETPIVAAGALMRRLPGGGAARWGGLALAPSVRGLSDGQLGFLMDGARFIHGSPYGPASALDLFHPQLIESLSIVKGPYALAWGSGLLGAIRAETADPLPGRRRIVFETGYTVNQNAFDAAGQVAGHVGAASYRLHGAYRTGNDYEDGANQTIPASFQSAEIQGYAGYQLASAARLTAAAGYVGQHDVDIPGRLFGIDRLRAANVSARFQTAWAAGPLRSLDVTTYWHRTAQDLDAQVTSEHFATTEQVTLGGRLAAQLAAGRGWQLEAGGDGYSLRTHADQDETPLVPGARQTSGGLFVSATRRIGRIESSATLRGDAFATRRNPSPTTSSSEQTSMALSGALAVTTPLTPAWTLSAAAGSSVRLPTVYERYARLPDLHPRPFRAVFGTPTLDPERGTQVDVWLHREHPSLAFTLHTFARRIARFITLAPADAEDYPAAVTPLRYINGTATHWGAEATATYALLGEFATLFGQASYLWGRNDTFDEPALGVPPLTATIGGRLEAPARLFVIEGEVHMAAPQDRVATIRGDVATDGYFTANGRVSISISRTTLLFGITNLFDATYADALNAQGPYSGFRLREPGRQLFARLRLRL